MKLFEINKPKSNAVPIVISFPHSGDYIPSKLRQDYNKAAIEFIDDTDWYLPQIYDFAQELGITTIKATHSRWVIDLNRNRQSLPLYNDGRLITGLCTHTNFLGDAIYNRGLEPDEEEIENRKLTYFWPYYKKVQELLEELKEEHGKVLLYDAHSIRSVVKTIQVERFPDMILGTADESSADGRLIRTTLKVLENSPYKITHNHPFKGGNITRTFGRPNENQHALQLERCKDLYMKNKETELDLIKAKEMSGHLKVLFTNLIATMDEL